MSKMSNQKGKPQFMCTLPKSTLDDLILVRKAFQNTLSENQLLKEDTKAARQQIKQLMAQISLMRAKLDQYEIQAGELTDESVSRKVQMRSTTKEKGNQACSAPEKTSIFDLEMNRLKEQRQQRDSEILILKQDKDSLEILILKQEKDSLSAKLAKLQKHEAPLKETQWNQKTQTENLEEEKEKVLEDQKLVKDTKEMQNKLDTQRKELVEAKTEIEDTATPESSSLEMQEVNQSAEKSGVNTKTLNMGEKLCVHRVIQLVVSQAIEKVSPKYKLFTERLTPDCISDRLIERIWPEIELKHLDLSPKWLKKIDKAILKDLCKTHNCKEKYLIFNLREQLDNITVPTFTKHLLALPRRVLSVSKNREEYKEVVKNFTKDLVMHAMSQGNETAIWHPGASDFIIQRISHKIWNKVLSKNYKMSLENIEQLSLTVYNELHDRWPSPVLLMKSSNPVVDEAIVKTFKTHAKLRSQNVIVRAFSWAR
ncbi:armadillo repeat-containing protein 1 [Sarotherodon galilaeus]